MENIKTEIIPSKLYHLGNAFHRNRPYPPKKLQKLFKKVIYANGLDSDSKCH